LKALPDEELIDLALKNKKFNLTASERWGLIRKLNSCEPIEVSFIKFNQIIIFYNADLQNQEKCFFKSIFRPKK
jgi:hypothetical protein